MLKLSSIHRSSLAIGAAGFFLGASVLVLAPGCVAPSSDGEDSPSSTESALAGSTAVSRAEEWVNAQLQYCQSANHQRDYDDACSTYCNRTDNAAWDPYRSDCSGLVSWAWELPAPGRVTGEFAPFQTDITHTISASSLQPGDAVNNSDHIMLFKGWVTPGKRASFIEEPGCATAITHAHELSSDVTISGSTIEVAYWGKTFTAIRYDGIGSGGGGGGTSGGDCVVGGLYCGGDKVSGDASTLYRCNGTSAPTVVEHCASGCSVNAGQDDSCKSGGGTSGGSCVAGGLYCGGDKVTGNASTLYRCNGPGTPSVVGQCSDGCEVRSGQDDACRGSGACVAGGLYCGGDKVTGDPTTLYRCTSGSSGTVVEHCASGCAVRSGQNDACK
jgi:hypothetical protein